MNNNNSTQYIILNPYFLWTFITNFIENYNITGSVPIQFPVKKKIFSFIKMDVIDLCKKKIDYYFKNNEHWQDIVYDVAVYYNSHNNIDKIALVTLEKINIYSWILDKKQRIILINYTKNKLIKIFKNYSDDEYDPDSEEGEELN